MLTLLLSTAIGCAAGPYGAPEGSTITLGSSGGATGWIFDGAYNDPDDGIGLLIREYAMLVRRSAFSPRRSRTLTKRWTPRGLPPSMRRQ